MCRTLKCDTRCKKELKYTIEKNKIIVARIVFYQRTETNTKQTV